MSRPHASKESLKSMASLTGLNLSDEKLEQLLPQIQQTVDAMQDLNLLDLESVEPAIVFIPSRK